MNYLNSREKLIQRLHRGLREAEESTMTSPSGESLQRMTSSSGRILQLYRHLAAEHSSNFALALPRERSTGAAQSLAARGKLELCLDDTVIPQSGAPIISEGNKTPLEEI